MAQVVVSWSGGKDAAMALADVVADPDQEVVELLTTVSAGSGRVRSHDVDGSLLDRQTEELGYPLRTVEIPEDAGNEGYERRLRTALDDYEDRDVDRLVFADLFLDSIREYRESLLEGHAIDGYWPLWGRDTDALAASFLDRGFRATVVRVDADALDAAVACREYDDDLLTDHPDVDPCGENGEFHTFVRDGPLFDSPVPVESAGRRTETVERGAHGGTYHYCDLRLAE